LSLLEWGGGVVDWAAPGGCRRAGKGAAVLTISQIRSADTLDMFTVVWRLWWTGWKARMNFEVVVDDVSFKLCAALRGSSANLALFLRRTLLALEVMALFFEKISSRYVNCPL